MKFFLFISLSTAILLGISVQLGMQKATNPSWPGPQFIHTYQTKIKEQFIKPENANILFGFVTGNKNGISPYTKNAFKKVNLSFLFSPSGIHIAGILIILNFLLKGIKIKWVKHFSKIIAFSIVFFLPGYNSIKRLMILRIIFQFKFLSKLKISPEKIFILTFICSFLLGHFISSPLSFIYSFAFLGTFFSLRNNSLVILILGLFSTQLILALFMGDKVSLISIPLGLLGSLIFSFMFPILLIFLLTYWCIHINWVEPIIRTYVLGVQMSAKYLNGSFTSSSIFLILAIWVLMYPRSFKRKYLLFCVLLFLHTNTAMTPSIFT
jgi:hypothetical protein